MVKTLNYLNWYSNNPIMDFCYLIEDANTDHIRGLVISTPYFYPSDLKFSEFHLKIRMYVKSSVALS